MLKQQQKTIETLTEDRARLIAYCRQLEFALEVLEDFSKLDDAYNEKICSYLIKVEPSLN